MQENLKKEFDLTDDQIRQAVEELSVGGMKAVKNSNAVLAIALLLTVGDLPTWEGNNDNNQRFQ